MIEFLNITLRNFLGYGNAPTVVNLKRPGTTLIVGQNLDNTTEGTGSNGVGKTTVLNAIVYALYDQPIGKIDKIDNLVNNINKKNMEVILEFIAEDGCHYKIHRGRKMKTGAEGNKVHLYKDGVDITRVPNSDTNIDIEKIVGVPYELFVRIIVFSATEDSFLKMKGTDQKAFIEELFGLTVVTERAEKLKKRIKETKADFDFKQAKIEQLEKERERHQVLIENAKKRVVNWKVQNQAAIDELFTKLEQIQNVDFEGEAFLHAKAGELKTKVQEKKAALREANVELARNQKEFNKFSSELEHLRDSKCPYCMQQFADAQTKIAELETTCLSASFNVNYYTSVCSDLTTELEALQTQYTNVTELITVPDLDSLVEIKNEAKNMKRKIAELDGATNPFEEPLNELELTKFEEIDRGELDKIKKVLDHQQFLLKLLTKNDSFVRKTLVSNNLPFLNKQLKKHLTSLGLPHVVEFTEELEPVITKMGSVFDFNLLSNGQKARLGFGLSIAFRDVRERLHGRTNLVFFDEVLDYGLDAPGVVACAQLLKMIARREGLSLYVISHREEVSNMFDKKLVVTMEKGFSYIIE